MNREERISQNKTLWTESEWKDVALFIGDNAETFKPTWEAARTSWIEKGKQPSTFLSWHWPALIPVLGLPWLAARKIWPLLWTIIGTIIAINLLAIFVKTPPSATAFIIFLVPIMAKNFYVNHAVTKIEKIKKNIPDEAGRTAAIQAAGGLHMNNGYIAGAACALLIILQILAL
jgi:hypothetical protein